MVRVICGRQYRQLVHRYEVMICAAPESFAQPTSCPPYSGQLDIQAVSELLMQHRRTLQAAIAAC